jgi:hypothetical protein
MCRAGLAMLVDFDCWRSVRRMKQSLIQSDTIYNKLDVHLVLIWLMGVVQTYPEVVPGLDMCQSSLLLTILCCADGPGQAAEEHPGPGQLHTHQLPSPRESRPMISHHRRITCEHMCSCDPCRLASKSVKVRIVLKVRINVLKVRIVLTYVLTMWS